MTAASEEEEAKKHPCPDCRFCQWCSDDRCRICRGEKKCPKKLSTAEQIELYERINAPGNSQGEKDKEKK